MKRIIREDVYIGKKIEIPVATVEQYDDLILELRVIDESVIVDPSEQFIELWAERPSKTIVQQLTGITTTSEYITINLKNSIISEYGLVDFQLKLQDTNGKIQTSRFSIKVNESIFNNNPEYANDEIQVLESISDELMNLQTQISSNDNDISNINTQLSNITILFKNSENIQNKLNQLESNVSVKFSSGVYEVDEPYEIINKSNITFDLTDAIFIQKKHGYCVFEFSDCNNINVVGGEIIGAGNFYPQTIDNESKTIVNEKVGRVSDWGESKNDDNSTNKASYNGGYLTNVGFGILLIEGNKNITIDNVECQNFNYVGIGVGYRGKIDGSVNNNITIKNCYCHDNFCAGIHIMHADGFIVANNYCENNGHPDAKRDDFDCDPGYGISCRNSESRPINGIISNNICKNNKRKGIDVHSGNHILIDSNIIEDCYRWGIALTRFNGEVDNIQLVNNTIRSSSYTLGGAAILCDSGGYNVIENNKIYGSGLKSNAIYCLNTNARVSNNVIVDSSTTGTNAHTILSWNSEVDIIDNILYNSGLESCMRLFPKNNSITNVKNNRITHDTNVKKIFVNVLNDTDYVTVNLIDNSIDGNEDNSIDFQAFKNANGIIENNNFCGNVYLDDSCDFNIGICNNGFKSSQKKAKTKPIGTISSTCIIEIENGVISFEDNNNIVTDVTNHDNGLTIKVGDRLIKGISWMYDGTNTQDVIDVKLRGIYTNNSADFSLYKENGSQYGNPSSEFNNSRLAFIITVI